MLFGHVCQLDYHGGGQVVYVTPTGESVVPFAPQRSIFRVGQRVSFLLRESEEAYGLQVTAVSKPESSERQRPGGVASCAMTRKFQEKMNKFHNLDAKAKFSKVLEAEHQLQQLLDEEASDGDALCKLVRRVAAWLSPLRLLQSGKRGGADGDAGDGDGSSKELQMKIRKLLILALSHLDLTHALTFDSVKAAVLYIRALLPARDAVAHNLRNHVKRAAGSAEGQWRQLQRLVQPEDVPKDAKSHANQAQRSSASSPLESDRHRGPEIHEKGYQLKADSTFHPYQKVKNLSSVYQSKRQVQLHCSMCSHILSSNWFWLHPNSGESRVLVPHNGHAACRRTAGKRSVWRSLDGTAIKLDNFGHLDLCPHNREKSKCKDCGGRQICIHGRRRSVCPLCRKPAPVRKSCTGKRTESIFTSCELDVAGTLSVSLLENN